MWNELLFYRWFITPRANEVDRLEAVHRLREVSGTTLVRAVAILASARMLAVFERASGRGRVK